MEPAAEHGTGGSQGHAVPALARGRRAAPRPQIRQSARGQALARQGCRLQPLPCYERICGRLFGLRHQPQVRITTFAC